MPRRRSRRPGRPTRTARSRRTSPGRRGDDNTEDARFSPGERYGRVYQINYLRCIFCGLCIEACPTRALTMTIFYELADDDRGKLIFEKQQLLAPLQEGMLPPPHPMVEGMEERDYYQGKVATATPGQRTWVELHESQPTHGTAATGDPVEGVPSVGWDSCRSTQVRCSGVAVATLPW